MMSMRAAILCTFAAAILISGCSLTSADDNEKYLILGSALTKLSSSVESAVRYKNPPSNATESELLGFATKHDPGLLRPFDGYTIRVKAENRHGFVLVCSTDFQKAILEDAGCTAKLDVHRYKEMGASCDFTLKAGDVCPE